MILAWLRLRLRLRLQLRLSRCADQSLKHAACPLHIFAVEHWISTGRASSVSKHRSRATDAIHSSLRGAPRVLAHHERVVIAER